MGQFRKEIEDINTRLKRLIEKYIRNPDIEAQATEARETMCPCVMVMDEILEEVQRFNKDVNSVMNEDRFNLDPDATVEAFETLEMTFSHAPEVVKAQVIIKRDELRGILDNILDKLDTIESKQQAERDTP